jgi:EmrB/QacA subfamily drug resistance transporter
MRRPLVLIACMLASFMAAIESTIVATAIPSIVADLGGFSALGWVFGAYLLAQAVTIPIYGRLADLYGRKRVLFVGTFVFLAGSALCGFAPSMPWLILCRALQGLGAGAILPVSSTIIGDIYSPAERAKLQGWLSSVWGVSAVAGPVLGAFIVEHLGWPVVFWVNLPIGLASVAALAAFFPERRESRPRAIDFAGAALLVFAVGLLMTALLQARALGGWTFALLAASALGFAALAVQERVTAEPLLPFALWRDRTILAGTLGSFAVGAAMMGCSAFLPVYVQGVMGRPVMEGGMPLALMSIAWPIASTLGGRLMLATSYRFNIVLGGLILIAGTVLLPVLLGSGSLAGANVAAFVIGGGLGLSSSTYLVAAQSAASQSLRGIATASTVFARMVGAALGTSVLGAVLNFRLGQPLGPGFAEDPLQALMDPALRGVLTAGQRGALAAAVGDALHTVFWAGAAFGAAAFAIGLLTPGGLGPGNIRAAAEAAATGSSPRSSR